jgi:predicted MPP superfamily phosphohydrolase
LSGHTHGGQVAPFGIATILPPGCGRYVAGWYRDSGPPMYVSRGIGTSLFPVRIGATPELVRIDWHLQS